MSTSAEAGRSQTTAQPTTEPAASTPATEIGTFHALKIRDFRLLWFGTAFGSGAMWIQQTTMGWLVFDLTGSGSALGVVGSVGSLPSPFLSPFAGLASDRFSRNVVVAVSQAALLINAMLLAAAIWLDVVAVWHLIGFALLAGVINAFNMPARQSMVFDVVPRDTVPNAVALSNLAFSTMRAVGPMIGGALIVAVGPGNNFVLQAVLYLGVLATVLMIPKTQRPAQAGPRKSLVGDLVEGYRYVMSDPPSRLLFMMMLIYPLFIIPLHIALLPIFARDEFGMPASGLGILLGSLGVGGILGGLLTASLNRVDRRGLLQLAALLLLGLSQTAFCIVAVMTEEIWYCVPFLILGGMGGSIFNTTNQTVLQLLAPNHLRGRVTSALQVHPICLAIGILFTGIASDAFGAGGVGIAISLMALSAGVVTLLFSPRMRKLRLSTLQPSGAP